MTIRGVSILAGVLIVGLGAYVFWPWAERWDREHPLTNPDVVVGVEGGRLTLADGRVLEPAGVARTEEVDPATYDAFLRAVTAQGIEVVRDLGDGRAMMRAEPKFWNWCGTCRRRGGNWAGSYFNVSLSEYLCYAGYAVPVEDQQGLTPRERWRLAAAEEFYVQPEPLGFRDDAIVYDSGARNFFDWDVIAEVFAGPPPRD